VRVWHAGTGLHLFALPGHGAWVHGVAFSPAGQRIASASADDLVRLWTDGPTPGRALGDLAWHGQQVQRCLERRAWFGLRFHLFRLVERWGLE
jgi:WD40 repeat protein